jgi:hypothetical protein
LRARLHKGRKRRLIDWLFEADELFATYALTEPLVTSGGSAGIGGSRRRVLAWLFGSELEWWHGLCRLHIGGHQETHRSDNREQHPEHRQQSTSTITLRKLNLHAHFFVRATSYGHTFPPGFPQGEADAQQRSETFTGFHVHGPETATPP